MTLISDITARLVALGLASGLGVDVFPLRFPPSPLSCIVIIPLGGRVPREVQGGTGVDFPGFQIQVRGTIELDVFNDAEAIRLALNDSTVGGYSIFTTRSQPSDVTSPEDLASTDGPLFRFSCDYETIMVR